MKKIIMAAFSSNWAWRWVKYHQTWRAHRDTIKQLNRLSDDQLKDVGLSRDDIDQLVWLEEDKIMRGRK
jgi:uncharacterized protein YjiS (DUF1127 family)|tara:strand:- start:2805 stop:3011 length:207 start_codon:yes stop_codon:yes gene_type:complete